MSSFDWPTHKVRPRGIGTEVTAYLERLISLGELRPGQKLAPEREIAELLDVSRASVRDALYELSLKGLIERRPGRGTIVLKTRPNAQNLLGAFDDTERQLLEVVDLRQAFEPSVAERAAERATPADLAQLEQVLADSHDRLSPKDSARLDREFHLLLATASQNGLLVTLATITADWLADVRTESHATRAGRAESIAGHRRILDAVRRRDQEGARVAMSDHVLGIGRLVREKRASSKAVRRRPTK